MLGFHDGGQVSRHERSLSSPTLQNAFAYAAIYGATVKDVFEGLSGETTGAMEKKVASLEMALLNTTGKGRQKSLRAQKLAWIGKRKKR